MKVLSFFLSLNVKLCSVGCWKFLFLSVKLLDTLIRGTQTIKNILPVSLNVW